MTYAKFQVGQYAVILNRNKEALILRLPSTRRYPNETWMLPGGRIDPDEDPIHSIRREVKEETDLRVKNLRPISTTIWSPPDKFVVFYRGDLNGPAKVRLSYEHADFRWVKPGQLRQYKFHRPPVRRAIKTAIKKINGSSK
jgi:8-oxo-dGTP pyrophosphatase MutT (NUDIX family)